MEEFNDSFTLFVESNWTEDEQSAAAAGGASSDVYWLNDPCRSFEFFMCTVLIGTVCLVGLFGNSLSFIVLGKDRQNRVATFLLRALAVADSSLLLISILVLSAILGPSQIPSTRPALSLVIPYMKKYVNPLGPMTQAFTIWMTVLLAINRYIAVCKPFAAKNLLTLRKAQWQVAIVAILSVAFNFPRFFQYDVVYRVRNNVTVPVRQVTDFGNNVSFDIGYFNVFYNIVILVLPLVVLVVLNTKIIWDLQKSKTNMQRNSLYYAGSQERNITIVMVIIILKLVIFHTPDRVMTAVKIFEVHRNPYLACPHPVIYAAHFANLLVILNSSSDFFIYCIFRQRFRRLFCFRFCWQSIYDTRFAQYGLERLPSGNSADADYRRVSSFGFFDNKRRHMSTGSINARLLSSNGSSRHTSREEKLPVRNGNGNAKHHEREEQLPVRNGSAKHHEETALPTRTNSL